MRKILLDGAGGDIVALLLSLDVHRRKEIHIVGITTTTTGFEPKGQDANLDHALKAWNVTAGPSNEAKPHIRIFGLSFDF